MSIRTVDMLSVYEGANFRRFWILAILAGVEKAGASPMGIKQFNLLAYFSNSVSRCYDIEPLDPTILKERSGPLYPQLLWDIDRLVGMRQVRVANLVMAPEGAAKSVSYAITRQGLATLRSCVQLSTEMKNVHAALLSAAVAFCRSRRGISGESLLAKDANFSDSKFGLGDVVDFGQWDTYDATANAVNYVKDSVDSALVADTNLAVNLYAKYLAVETGK